MGLLQEKMAQEKMWKIGKMGSGEKWGQNYFFSVTIIPKKNNSDPIFPLQNIIESV